VRPRSVLVLASLTTVVVAQSAGAAGQVDARVVSLDTSGALVATQPFRLVVQVEETEAGPPHRFTVTVTLPPTFEVVELQAACTTETGLIRCTTPLTYGTLVGFRPMVRVDAPGSYRISARVEATDAVDADPSNDTAALNVTVATAPAGSAASAGRLRVLPARPVAGKPVTVVLPLTRAGDPVRPTSVSCPGRLGSRAVAGRPVRSSSGAACRWTTTAASRGKRLRGSVVARVDEQTFRRSFSVTLR
jgi:hypothetical protein